MEQSIIDQSYQATTNRNLEFAQSILVCGIGELRSVRSADKNKPLLVSELTANPVYMKNADMMIQ
jgi:hypothetical protein